MRQIALDINERSGEVKLGVHVDTSDTDRVNALTKLENGKGFTAGRTLREVAAVPFDFVQALAMSGDVDGVVLFDVNADPFSKKKALRGLLKRFPEFKTSEGAI